MCPAKFDPFRHIDLSNTLVTIDSVFTSMAMKNFAVDDWDQLREITRHVPLYHPFRRVYVSLGEEM